MIIITRGTYQKYGFPGPIAVPDLLNHSSQVRDLEEYLGFFYTKVRLANKDICTVPFSLSSAEFT